MSTKPFEFEQALKELEDITVWFESSNVDLDAGLVKFERGMELAQALKEHLAQVENRVEKIKQRFSGSTAAAQDTVAETPSTPAEAGTADESEQADLFGV